MQVLIFNKFGLKLPIHAPWFKKKLFGDLPPKWGAASSRPPKGNAFRRKSYTAYKIVKIGPSVFAQHAVLPYPQFLCFTMLFNLPDTPKVPLTIEASASPSNTWFLWAHSSQHPERHHDRFSSYLQLGIRSWPTDRQTDHATPSVAIRRI